MDLWHSDEADEGLALESALEPVLLSMLGGGTAAGITLTPQRVRAMIEPVLAPLTVSMMLRLRRVAKATAAVPSPLTASVSDLEYSDKVFQLSQQAVVRASEEIAKILTEPKQRTDIYDQTDDGDAASEARRVSRSVSTYIVEWVKDLVAEDAGMTHKQWHTRLDGKVRPAHVYLEGALVPIDQMFQTTSGMIGFPGDRSADISMWIQCRCRLSYRTLRTMT